MVTECGFGRDHFRIDGSERLQLWTYDDLDFIVSRAGG
jgi:hypothetical protein